MNWSRIGVVIRLGVTGAAGWLVFHSIDWGVLTGLFGRADLSLLALAVLLTVAQFGLMVLRWQAVIETLSGVSVAGAHLALSFGRSLLASQFLPSTVGEMWCA